MTDVQYLVKLKNIQGVYSMPEDKKPLKVIFEPGCFDNFNGTQEELDDLVKYIQETLSDPEFLENLDAWSEPLTEEEMQELDLFVDTDPDWQAVPDRFHNKPRKLN